MPKTQQNHTVPCSCGQLHDTADGERCSKCDKRIREAPATYVSKLDFSKSGLAMVTSKRHKRHNHPSSTSRQAIKRAEGCPESSARTISDDLQQKGH